MPDPASTTLTPWLARVRPRDRAQPDAPIASARPLRWVRRALLAALALYVLAFAGRAYVRKYAVFLPDYARWTLSSAAPLSWVHAERPTHVFVLIADHFEPDWNR